MCFQRGKNVNKRLPRSLEKDRRKRSDCPEKRVRWFLFACFPQKVKDLNTGEHKLFLVAWYQVLDIFHLAFLIHGPPFYNGLW
jgi:hypothetical protein